MGVNKNKENPIDRIETNNGISPRPSTANMNGSDKAPNGLICEMRCETVMSGLSRVCFSEPEVKKIKDDMKK